MWYTGYTFYYLACIAITGENGPQILHSPSHFAVLLLHPIFLQNLICSLLVILKVKVHDHFFTFLFFSIFLLKNCAKVTEVVITQVWLRSSLIAVVIIEVWQRPCVSVYSEGLFQSFTAVKTTFIRNKSSLLLFRHPCVLFSLRRSRTYHKIPDIVRAKRFPRACSDIPHGYTDLCIHFWLASFLRALWLVMFLRNISRNANNRVTGLHNFYPCVLINSRFESFARASVSFRICPVCMIR